MNQEYRPSIKLTSSQNEVLKSVRHFIHSDDDCMILTGSAGTGKTTLIKALSEMFVNQSLSFSLLAPTGRAARVLSDKTDYAARTIHSQIYHLHEVKIQEENQDHTDPGIRYYFPLKQNDDLNMIYVIDESSMVGNQKVQSDTLRFGSGKLLSDLIEFLRLGTRKGGRASGNKIIFVGDPIQLPPVGSDQSALDESYLKEKFQLSVQTSHLTQVMRQAQDSPILSLANSIRDAIETKMLFQIKYHYAPPAITQQSILGCIDQIAEGIKNKASRIAITYSNAEAYRIQFAVREVLFGNDQHPLSQGEILLVNRNHHVYDLNNGDFIEVIDVGQQVKREIHIKSQPSITLRYREILAKPIHIANAVAKPLWILENLLWSVDRDESPSLMQALIIDVHQRYPHLKRSSKAFSMALQKDHLFNALRVRFGYAVTCHKAQGGEWDQVFVNIPSHGINKSEMSARWFYTAITRAKSQLCFIDDARTHSTDSVLNQGSEQKQAQSDVADAHKVYVANLRSLDCQQRVEVGIKKAFENLGITLLELAHKSFMLRCKIIDQQQHYCIDLNYNKKCQVSRITNAPDELRTSIDHMYHKIQLVDQSHQNTNQNQSHDHAHMHHDDQANHEVQKQMQDLCAHLPKAEFKALIKVIMPKLHAAGILIIGTKVLPYRFRLFLSGPNGEGQIDFIHKASMQWSSCQIVSPTATAWQAVSICS